MKNINNCIVSAKYDITNYCTNVIGFVVVKNSNDVINKWGAMGYNATYDYIMFSQWDEMKNYINGLNAFDYLDNAILLHNDERVVYGCFIGGKITGYDKNKKCWNL